MPVDTDSKTPRETILAQLTQCDTIERGTLTAEYREAPSPDGAGTLRRGPYFKHQCWENGSNRSVRVPPEQVARLREDLEKGGRFDQLTAQLAHIAVEKGRSERAALSAAPVAPSAATEETAKKNSARSVLRNDTARAKPSSPRSAKRSRGKA